MIFCLQSHKSSNCPACGGLRYTKQRFLVIYGENFGDTKFGDIMPKTLKKHWWTSIEKEGGGVDAHPEHGFIFEGTHFWHTDSARDDFWILACIRERFPDDFECFWTQFWMILRLLEELYRAFGTIDRPSLEHCIPANHTHCNALTKHNNYLPEPEKILQNLDVFWSKNTNWSNGDSCAYSNYAITIGFSVQIERGLHYGNVLQHSGSSPFPLVSYCTHTQLVYWTL